MWSILVNSLVQDTEPNSIEDTKGTCIKCHRSEWTTLLLVARVEQDEARISQWVEQVIIAQSVPFEKDKVYPKGGILDVGGNRCVEALSTDGADITRSDPSRKRFGIRGYEVEWAT